MTAQLAAALDEAGVSWTRVAGYRQLAGGTFNDVRLVHLHDGSGLVVKLAPDPAGPMLEYERGILRTEAMYDHMAGQHAGVTVPSVLAIDTGNELAPGGFLVMSACPGSTWREAMPAAATWDQDKLRDELGRQVAVLHSITGGQFGYPSAALGRCSRAGGSRSWR
jgi:hypothetical protein